MSNSAYELTYITGDEQYIDTSELILFALDFKSKHKLSKCIRVGKCASCLKKGKEYELIYGNDGIICNLPMYIRDEINGDETLKELFDDMIKKYSIHDMDMYELMKKIIERCNMYNSDYHKMSRYERRWFYKNSKYMLKK